MNSKVKTHLDNALLPTAAPITVDQLTFLIAKAVEKALDHERTTIIDSPLTESEAAKKLDVKPQTMAVWRTRGVGPAYYKIGSNVRYYQADLEAYCKQCRISR